MNYHAVHHMHPRVPFHQLRRAFDATRRELRHVEERGYLRAHTAVVRAALDRPASL